MVTLILVVFANPDNVDRSVGALHWLPLNLWLSGDSIYYVLYALFGRAVGMPDTSRQAGSELAGRGRLCCARGGDCRRDPPADGNKRCICRYLIRVLWASGIDCCRQPADFV